MPASSSVLVFGSTGPQGTGVVHALVELNKSAGEEPHKVLAVTRDPRSDKAKALAALPEVEVVGLESGNIEALFKRASERGGIWGVFSVQHIFQDHEVQQGIEIADLSVKYGARHLVWTGIDFSGQNPTPIPYFETKRKIEAHIRALPAGPTHWTILRPTGFMENYHWDLYRDSVLTIFNPERKMKMISTMDIGKIAVQCMSRSDEFNGRVLEIAADAQTASETAETWYKVTGSRLSDKKPELPEAILQVMKFNAAHEFLADVSETRRLFPGLMDFETWLRSTPFAKKD